MAWRGVAWSGVGRNGVKLVCRNGEEGCVGLFEPRDGMKSVHRPTAYQLANRQLPTT